MSAQTPDEINHLIECNAFGRDSLLRPAPCICKYLNACGQRVWRQMFDRIEDRMTDTDMDNLVSDDGKEIFWATIRDLQVTP